MSQGTAPPVPTSLSREASRCRGLSDIMNCRVVSDFGAGPVFMGANWILRMTRRTEFLQGKKLSSPAPRQGRVNTSVGTCWLSLGTSQCL